MSERRPTSNRINVVALCDLPHFEPLYSALASVNPLPPNVAACNPSGFEDALFRRVG
jgi:hypothetical protein